jgi:hypothetical protein
MPYGQYNGAGPLCDVASPVEEYGIYGDSDPNSRACFILQCSAVN